MDSSRRSSYLQRWLFTLLVLAFGWVLVNRFAEIRELIGTLAQGKWYWIAAAAAVQLIYYIAYAALFQAAFATVDIQSRVRDLVPIVFAALFINSTTPSGGTAGLALFVDDIRRRGGSAAKATAGSLLFHTSNYLAFLLILVVGLLVLFAQNNLTGLEITSAVLMVVQVGALGGTLVLGRWWSSSLRRLFGGIAWVVNGVGRLVRRPDLLPEMWAEQYAADFIAAADAIASHPERLGRVLLMALLAHGINIVCLACLFLAYEQPLYLSWLTVGYSMTVLFMVISPTPSGIGVVEAILPIVYSSLGLATSAGTIITLSFRGLSFWLPMLIGFVLLRQLKMFGRSKRALAENGQVRLLALLTATMGLLNVLSTLRPAWIDPFAAVTRFSPLAVQQSGHITAVITGFLLLILALGLWRHKRMAWLLTLLVLLVSIISHLLKPDLTEAALAAVLALYLWVQRTHFHALSDRPSIGQGVQVFAAALAFTLAYGTVGFYVLDRYYGLDFHLSEAWQQTLLLFSTHTEPTLIPSTPFDYLADSIYIVGAVTIGYALAMLLRPVLLSAPATEGERRRAEAIIRQYGLRPQQQLALLPDKSYFFTPGGSVVAYALSRRTAVALGTVIGPPDDQVAGTIAFQEMCQRHDWITAFYGVPAGDVPLYQAAGLEAVLMGYEGIVSLETAPTPEQTAQMGYENERFAAAGWQVHFLTPPYSQEIWQELHLVNDEWLSLAVQEEHPFAQGWFDQAFMQNGTVVVVSAAAHGVVAFALLLSSPKQDRLWVDLLRYRRHTPSMVLAWLLQQIVVWSRAQGHNQVSLGLSGIEATRPQITSLPWRERLLFRFYRWLDKSPPVDVLRPLKMQLAPEWEPRYLIYPSPTALPIISAALNRLTGVS